MAYFIAGPTKVQVDYGSGYSDLGYTDNDDLPQYDEEEMQELVESTAVGRSPNQAIFRGRKGSLTFTLVLWDETIAAAIVALRPQIGQGYIDQSKTVAVKFVPTNASDPATKEFLVCVPTEGSNANLRGWGNTPMRRGFAFDVLLSNGD